MQVHLRKSLPYHIKTMKRYSLTLDLKNDPELIQQYEEQHRAVWPEIINSIKLSGIENMQIYRFATRLFMIMEVNDNFSFQEKEEAAVQPYLKIHPDDNVLVALRDLSSGTPVSFDHDSLVLQQDVGAKHKFFTRDLMEGDEVIMYGTLVGKAQTYIPKGGLMTT